MITMTMTMMNNTKNSMTAAQQPKNFVFRFLFGFVVVGIFLSTSTNPTMMVTAIPMEGREMEENINNNSNFNINNNNNMMNVVQVHGSGTSNPFRCFGHVLEEMEGQTKIPTRMTYRATATGDGIKDFIGNVTTPNNDFASGDVPLSSDEYNLLQEQGIEMLHLPMLLGAIGIFHSVPVLQTTTTTTTNTEGGALLEGYHALNMTSCVLARIFRRDITDWKHPDIVKMNPNLDIPVRKDSYGNIASDQSFPITVARRLLGSSSTFAFTKYLYKSCPLEWPKELTGNVIPWPRDTQICEGSSLMVNCIRDTVGTIGYVDAGIGIDEGLTEVALKMNSGVSFRNGDFYLTAGNAINKGGILPVLDEPSTNIPNSADVDWSGVDLIDQVDGFVYSWPIIVMSYIYVRKDLASFIPDPRAQSLLVAFLKNMYNDDYVDVCETRYGFTRVSGRTLQVALEGIEMLQTSPDAPVWIMEGKTVLPEGGQGDYVISSRRRRSLAIEQEILMNTVELNENYIQRLEERIERLTSLIDTTLLNDAAGTGGGNNFGFNDDKEFGKSEDNMLTTSFVLSILSLSLWFATFLYLFVLRDKLSNVSEKQASIAEKLRMKKSTTTSRKQQQQQQSNPQMRQTSSLETN